MGLQILSNTVSLTTRHTSENTEAIISVKSNITSLIFLWQLREGKHCCQLSLFSSIITAQCHIKATAVSLHPGLVLAKKQ